MISFDDLNTLRTGALALPVTKSSTEVVLFGSHARGTARERSDIDLLCVGRQRGRKRVGRYDVVCVLKGETVTFEWLHSELASHVSSYGIWLKGDSAWAANVVISDVTLANKMRRIRQRLRLLEKHWDLLSPLLRARSVMNLRRDLQRHRLLVEGWAVPSVQEIDNAWMVAQGLFGADVYRWLVDGLDEELAYAAAVWLREAAG